MKEVVVPDRKPLATDRQDLPKKKFAKSKRRSLKKKTKGTSLSKKKSLQSSSKKKRALGRILPLVGLIVGLLLILYPFLPEVIYFFQGGDDRPLELPYQSVIAEKVGDSDDLVEIGKPIPLDNTLVIPKIDVDIKIVEGSTEDALLRGAWHRPGTGNPIDGGNYVVTGHRFRYVPPNNTTFYNLDKLEAGDLIIVYYEGQEYDYQVEESFVVEPEELHVEDDLGYDVLTLYTCTPLWTSSKRLVIRALPI